MKRLIIVALAVVLATLVFGAGAVVADNGPHGNYTATTDACAGCHRAHTGQAANLLAAESAYALCISCHNGTGANTNVVDGLWTPTGGSLRGGGFVNVTMDHALNGGPGVSAPVTSAHVVGGMNGIADGAPTGTVWGLGPISATSAPGKVSFALGCTSCHAQHGMGGYTADGSTSTAVATYRILRGTPTEFTTSEMPDLGRTAASVPDPATKVYTVTSAADNYYGQTYPEGTSDIGSGNDKIATVSTWCARCHARIHASNDINDPTSHPSGDAIYKYRHATSGWNVGTRRSGGAPACLTCHVSHGTSATMTGFAADVPEPGSTTVMQDSALLRLDNRAVCMECHALAVGGTTPPAQ